MNLLSAVVLAVAATSVAAMVEPYDDPVASTSATVVHGAHRCTVLTSGMVRIETAKSVQGFDDRQVKNIGGGSMRCAIAPLGVRHPKK